jgi:uncharacterized protein YnzC (UPF0291/DUF896 family)
LRELKEVDNDLMQWEDIMWQQKKNHGLTPEEVDAKEKLLRKYSGDTARDTKKNIRARVKSLAQELRSSGL